MEITPVHNRKYGPEFEESMHHILIHPYFQSLKAYVHHGKQRYEHSIYVAYNTYVMAKKCGLDAQQAGEGALLHDFFFDRTPAQKKELRKEQKGLKKLTTMQGFQHPQTASNNARKYFGINDKQAAMIETHMFPMTIKPPRNREGWLLTLADKLVAIREMSQTFCKSPIRTITGQFRVQDRYSFA
ncbi:MAG: HD domain-containing protein [Eubacteriaceae bacterium]|jgi:uncharacterized protein